MRSAPVAKDATIFARDINALRSDARGGAALSAHQTLGKLALPTNPSDGQTATFTINGSAIVVRFKSTLATANDVKIGADAASTSSNLFNFLTSPHITNSNQIAASSGDQVLLGYLSYNTVITTTYVGSVNTVVNPALTSFSCSTTVTSGVYTANTMTLFVQSGTAYVNGTKVKFAGGLAPTVTAPSSNPRIDLLTIDSSGTLAWTTGSENASPTTPTYPVNKVPIVEIYNVVGETSINDNENQASGQGYVLYDVRGVLQVPLNPAALPYSLIPAADGSYDLGSLSLEFGSIYAKNGIFLAGQSLNQNSTTGFTAGENLTAGQPIVILPAPVADVTLDTKLTGSSSSANITTGSVTIGSNSNRILVVFVHTNANNSGLTASFAGNSMTKAFHTFDSGTGYSNDVFILTAPPTGSGTLSLNNGAVATHWAIYSYYNADQTLNPEVTPTLTAASNNPLNFNASALNSQNASLLVSFMYGTAGSITNGTIFANNTSTSFGGAVAISGDSGPLFRATTVTASLTSAGNASATAVYCFIRPVQSSTTAKAYRAASDFALNATAFVGFAVNTVASGGTVSVVTNGTTSSGISGLTISAQYYLANTAGTIGTSPGTVSRKVGIATGTTAILVTNTW